MGMENVLGYLRTQVDIPSPDVGRWWGRESALRLASKQSLGVASIVLNTYLGSSRPGFEPMSVRMRTRAASSPHGNVFWETLHGKQGKGDAWLEGPFLPSSVARGHESVLWAGYCH